MSESEHDPRPAPAPVPPVSPWQADRSDGGPDDRDDRGTDRRPDERTDRGTDPATDRGTDREVGEEPRGAVPGRPPQPYEPAPPAEPYRTVGPYRAYEPQASPPPEPYRPGDPWQATPPTAQLGWGGQAPPPAQTGPMGEQAFPPAWPERGEWPAQQQVDTLGRPDRQQRRGRRGLGGLVVVLALLAGLVGGVAGGVLDDRYDVSGLVGVPSGTRPTFGAEGTAAGDAVVDKGTVADIAARVLPSVVSIGVQTEGGTGTGSGFVIDASGLVLTNNHVVRGAGDGAEIIVQFADGSQAPAEVVGAEASYDIAVLRVDPAVVGMPLEALSFGDSDDVVVGEQVVAVGAPLGLDSTVTTGIVSALNRPVSAGDAQQTAFINAIQTDAAINPGNSGGPLVNLRGQVVGVNSAIAQAPGGRAGGSIGLGFSIPSNQASRTAGQLVETGRATYPVVGVLLDRSYVGEGVRIVTEQDAQDTPPIIPGGPAEAAGLEPGDVVLAFEGRPMTEPDELVVAIRAQEPGDEVTLTVRRGEDVFDVSLVLEAGDQG